MTTLGCHLCEDALVLLEEARKQDLLQEIEAIEIADQDQLVERYGIRIPVVIKEDQAELGWPFTFEQLRTFLIS